MFSLLSDAYKTSKGLYLILRKRFFQLAGYFLIASFVIVGLNYLGCKFVNIIFGLIFPFVASYVSTNPSLLEKIVLLGVAKGPNEPIKNSKELLKVFAEIVGNVILCFSILCIIAGTASFSRNFWAVPVVFLSIFLFVMMQMMWGMKPLISKKLIYIYNVLVFVVAFGSAISAGSYVNLIGFDPYTWNRVSEADETVADIKAKMADNYEAKRQKELAGYKLIIDAGRDLAPNQLKRFNELQNETAQKSLPVKAKKIINSALSSKPVPPPRQKVWHQIGETKTFIGQGMGENDQYLRVAQIGKDLLAGNRITIISNEFSVWSDGWKSYNNEHTELNTTGENGKFFGVKAPTGALVKVKIDRLV